MKPDLSEMGHACPHQRGHVSSVHLPCGDLLLRGGHRPRVVGVGASHRAGSNDARERHRAVFHAAHSIELLLQNCGPQKGENEITSADEGKRTFSMSDKRAPSEVRNSMKE